MDQPRDFDGFTAIAVIRMGIEAMSERNMKSALIILQRHYCMITFFMDLAPVLVTISNRYIPSDRRLVFISDPFSEYK